MTLRTKSQYFGASIPIPHPIPPLCQHYLLNQGQFLHLDLLLLLLLNCRKRESDPITTVVKSVKIDHVELCRLIVGSNQVVRGKNRVVVELLANHPNGHNRVLQIFAHLHIPQSLKHCQKTKL